MGKAQFKRIKLPPVAKVHSRGVRIITNAEFVVLCEDIVQRKGHPQKQRINEHACRLLRKHALDELKNPTKTKIRALVQSILDPILDQEIQAHHLPFVHEDERAWHLAANVSLKKPSTWQAKRIVGRTIDENGQVLYEVEWENTLEPRGNVHASMVKEFEQRMKAATEAAYIEVEATEDNTV